MLPDAAVVLNLFGRYCVLGSISPDAFELKLLSPLGGWKKVLPNCPTLFSLRGKLLEPGLFGFEPDCPYLGNYGVFEGRLLII